MGDALFPALTAIRGLYGYVFMYIYEYVYYSFHNITFLFWLYDVYNK